MGAQVRALDLGIEDVPLFIGGMMVSQFDLIAAAAALSGDGAGAAVQQDPHRRVAACGGRRHHRRAVDRHQPQPHLADRLGGGRDGRAGGRAALGRAPGVQFSLSLVVLKALPVLIIGGFTSIGGAIVGGLIVGAAENLAEVYIGPLIGGGITPGSPTSWPWPSSTCVPPACSASAPSSESEPMSISLTRETAPAVLVQRRLPFALMGLLLIAFVVVPLTGNDYWLNAILIPFLVLSLAGLG
jgi:hypothetical protein